MQLPPVSHCCCFPIAWLPQLVSFGSGTGLQGGGDSPCPSSAGPFPGLGPGPWGLGLETAVTTKQLKLRRPREVLAAGVILGLACHPQLLFPLGAWGEGPLVLFLGSPLPPCLLPSLSARRGGNRDHSGCY